MERRRTPERSRSPSGRAASPVPIATLPKAAAAPRERSNELPKRKKRRKKDKGMEAVEPHQMEVPGVTPKAAPPHPPVQPTEVQNSEAPDDRGSGGSPSKEPRSEPRQIQTATKPKRRAKKRPSGASEAKPEEPAVEVANEEVKEKEKELKAGGEAKEGRKRRKRRVEKEEDDAQDAVLIAAVEEMAPGQEEQDPPAPKVKRRRRKKEAPQAIQPEKPEEGSAEVNAKYGELIRGVYQRHNPAKLGEVESLLLKYQGMEAELYHRVCEKYQEKPQDADRAEPEARGDAAGQAKAPPKQPSRVATGEAWPFEEDEVSMNSESSGSSSSEDVPPGVLAPPPTGAAPFSQPVPPSLALPPSGVFDAPNSPSSASGSSKRSDELLQRFSSLAEPKTQAPGLGDSRAPPPPPPPPRPPDHRSELPGWAKPNGQEAIPAWALPPQDGPPGDWGRRYPGYGGPPGRMPPPGPPGPGGPGGPPGGWGGKGWGGYPPAYPALPSPQAQSSWSESIGSAWAQ